MSKYEIRRRKVTDDPNVSWPVQMPETIRRIYAARGITDERFLDNDLAHLLSPSTLGDVEKAVDILLEAIVENKSIMVAGDYDCDGATGSAVAVRGLRMLGAQDVRFIVPDRHAHGYGLSRGLIDAMDPLPQLIVTVDSGVASVDGVAYAKSKGIQVVVTDHHLPGDVLPEADALVNPNLNGDAFPSKALAGVGVMFYLLIAMRSKARELGWWPANLAPRIQDLLPIVAVGTIADLVVLDRNNRILVAAGLRQIRQGRIPVGLKALIESAGKNPAKLIAQDVGFAVAPRINAAGRLENMKLGVEVLLSDHYDQALTKVKQLEAINTERKEVQAAMVADAEAMIAQMTETSHHVGVTVFDPSWHAGVVGLVASKLKETLHRPVFALAPAHEGSDDLRGSGRSIAGFHLRDALAKIDAAHPGLMDKFGGHAMAAGMSIQKKNVEEFAKAFDKVASETLEEEHLQAVVYTDGELAAGEISMDMAQWIRMAGPWGQGFPEPAFDNVFLVKAWQAVGNGHLRLFLQDPRDGTTVEAMQFFGYTGEAPPLRARVAYELSVNEWNERESLQLLVRHLEAA